MMRAVLSNQDELNARIYRFPTSAIKQNDRKINYYDFLMATGNKDCNAAVMRMMPRFHLEKFLSWMNCSGSFTRFICLPEWKESWSLCIGGLWSNSSIYHRDFICECKVQDRFRIFGSGPEFANNLITLPGWSSY